jgi:hypothetical protein
MTARIERLVLSTVLAVFAAIAGGCSVQGEQFRRAELPGVSSAIYVYRPYHYEGSAIRPAVACGDSSVELGPGGYHPFVVDPGKPTCTVRTETTDAIEIRALPGRAYYVKEEMGWGIFIGHPHLYPMDADQAQTEIESCCRLQ